MRAMLTAALVLVAACGRDEGTGGLSADESRQLNEAAAMLDSAPDALPAPDENVSQPVD